MLGKVNSKNLIVYHVNKLSIALTEGRDLHKDGLFGQKPKHVIHVVLKRHVKKTRVYLVLICCSAAHFAV